MNIKGRLINCETDFLGDCFVTFKVSTEDIEDVTSNIEDYVDRELDISYKPYFKKRSLNANAYLWVLIGKIAFKLNVPKEEIYQNFIRDMGIYSTVSVQNEAIDDLINVWNSRGLGWFVDILDKGEIKSEIALYYGSSVYTTDQMKRLLDYTIQEAKLQGIQTETPDEIANMLSLWESGSKGA